MKKTKLVIAALAAVMALSAVSCGDAEKNSESEQSSETVTTEAATEAATETSTEEAEEETEAEDATGDEIENPFGDTIDIMKYIDSTEITPPLWKVTDPDSGKTMYLMGTIHALPSAVKDYPENIMEIYNDCDAVAVEYDISKLSTDAVVANTFAQAMLYTDGTTIKDHISEETYNKAKNYFESIGGYTEMLDQYNTGFWIEQILSVNLYRMENLELSGTDAYFIEKAQADGKEVISIEELSTQTDALNAYSDELADYLISDGIDTIDDIEDFAESYSELYNPWSKGDGEIPFDEADDVDELPEDLLDDYAAYKKILLTDRNKGMADRATELIKGDKTVFFMVGAAHYSDVDGVDNLLEEMGFTVEKIA